MKPTTLLALLVLTAACASNQLLPTGQKTSGQKAMLPVAAQQDAQGVAKAFYTALRRERISGLPSDAQLEKLAPYLTPALLGAFQHAAAEQGAFSRKNPDEKPPWIEGDLFSSLFEGVETWQLGTAAVKGSSAEVPVNLTYRGDSKETARWTDTLALTQTPADGWRVADIHMCGTWAFKAGGNTLSQTLTAKP